MSSPSNQRSNDKNMKVHARLPNGNPRCRSRSNFFWWKTTMVESAVTCEACRPPSAATQALREIAHVQVVPL